jgi:hypothetical protein
MQQHFQGENHLWNADFEVSVVHQVVMPRYVIDNTIIPLQIDQIIFIESSKVISLESSQPINSIKSQVWGGLPDLPDFTFSLRRLYFKLLSTKSQTFNLCE